MIESSDLRMTRIPLNHGAGRIPALGFGTLIPDAAETITATRDALEAGFRHFDCAERYRNEREVGEALHAGLAAEGIAREDIFVTSKLWNSNHRPERVEPALDASLDRLRLRHLDLYLIHTPFAFQPGDEQDPRDQDGNVLYDNGVTLLTTVPVTTNNNGFWTLVIALPVNLKGQYLTATTTDATNDTSEFSKAYQVS